MTLVELEHVTYRYEDAPAPALSEVNLSIGAGEYVLLAGASGSGKSTLCRLLNGLIPHFHGGTLDGRVSVDGLATREHPVRELFAHAGLVFQNPTAQLFNSTVAHEIAFGLESAGLPREEIQSRTEWALDVTALARFAGRAPHTLSGGEQQRVAIAAMLALRPRILVLDEPFANLDGESIERVKALLGEIHAQGTVVLLAEHRLSVSLEHATRLVILDRGRVVRDGAPRAILREDVSPLGLETPYVVRVARESGWRQVPLSVPEAVATARVEPRVVLPQRTVMSVPEPVPGGLPVIQMQDVTFARETGQVLQHVDLSVSRGESLALVGRNGSGKTTLLKHLIGIYRPVSGSVRVLGMDTRRVRVSDLARAVGFVFQNPNDQLFKPNVREELEVAPRALGRLDAAWLDRLVGWFQLEPLLERSPFTLSEGEKKRVAFAAALAAHPEIVLLDEPTTGQDYAFRTALERLLVELRSEGITTLFATHDPEFAEEAAARWVVLSGGSLIGDGTPDEVMQDDAMLARAGLHATARARLAREWSPQAVARVTAYAPCVGE